MFIEDGGKKDEREKEADEFARDFLIKPSKWKNFIQKVNYTSRPAIEKFADEQLISPAIVIGRLQYERRLPWRSQLNQLKRRYGFKTNI